jgi:hypothetical protein
MRSHNTICIFKHQVTGNRPLDNHERKECGHRPKPEAEGSHAPIGSSFLRFISGTFAQPCKRQLYSDTAPHTLDFITMSLISTRFQRRRVLPKHNILQCFSHKPSLSIVSFRSPFRTMSACHDCDTDEYYRYASGRWLLGEDAQLRERYKGFNVAELKKTAAKAIGAATCVSMSKLAEGGFNKICRLVMDDGKIVIARIPNPNVGPPSKTTASEVATMDFVS